MAARYLVCMPPGAPIEGVGYVKVGEEFTAPSEKYVPSLTMRPLNEEAQTVLDKVFAAETARREKARDRAKEGTPQREAMQQHLEALSAQREKNLPIVVLPREEPKKGPGVSMDELAKLSAGGGEPKDDEKKPSQGHKGTRAADR